MDTTPAQPPLSRSVTISNHPTKAVTIAPRSYTASYSIAPKEHQGLNVITLHSANQNQGVFST